MKKKSFTLDIPERLVKQLEAIAQASETELNEVIIQTLKGGMPPSLRKIPSKFHNDLLKLNALNDLELWDVIAEPKKKRREIENREDVEHVGSMRRAYAFSLLKWRGHPVPSPADFMLA